MRDAVAELMDVVTLEERGTDCFRGLTPDMGWKRVFGGQVVAQALAAALATVEAERHVHSLHGYFLRPGGHSLLKEDWKAFLDFADQHLGQP